jgi:hypothetical protein
LLRVTEAANASATSVRTHRVVTNLPANCAAKARSLSVVLVGSV